MVARETNLVNAFETTLAAQLASGGSTMNLADDPGVDSPAYFVIDPDNDSNREVVLWSSGTNHAAATVTRDIDSKHGTDPTHASGTKVRLAVVKQHIEEAHDAIQQGFVLEDGDGTEVTINPAVASGVYTQREVKFVEGGGIDIDWTDTDNGTDGDPYDLTFTVNVDTAEIAADAITEAKIADDAVESEHLNDNVISGQTELASGLALTDELLVSDAGTVKRMDVSLIADAIDGDGIDVSSGTLVNAAIGKQSIWVPATAMYPTTSNGCADIASVETTAGRPDLKVLDFDGSTAENAQFSIAMPSYWNESTITFQVYWTSTATDTDAVIWDLSAVAVSDNDTIDVAFGSEVAVTDNALSAAEDLCVTAESTALTVGGTPAAGDLVYFNIARDADEGGDTAAEDARLIGIKIFYTVDDVHEA
tara:strand:+ start:3098 stop:4360 length:1263 start_codon:yes stop_codon:yes gene_type:complete